MTGAWWNREVRGPQGPWPAPSAKLPVEVISMSHPSMGLDGDPIPSLGQISLLGPSLLDQRLPMTMASSIQRQRELFFGLVDLDPATRAVEELGPSFHDDILAAIATRLRGSLREVDSVLHLGGDRFSVIVERPGDAEKLGRRLVEAAGEPMDISGISVWVTVSLGAVIGTFADAETFVQLAERALDRSRNLGGDSATIVRAM